MKKLLLLIAVFALLIPAGLTACKQQPETKTFKVMHEEKFGGIYFDSTIDAFNALGFSYGDSVDIEFSNGTSMKDLPYYNGYYVDIGDPLLVAYPGYPYIEAAINYGDDPWIGLGLDDSCTATITLKEKGKYLSVQNARDITYSDEQGDTEDAVFGNFRSVNVGSLKQDILFRSASPCNNEHNRAAVVDRLISAAGIGFIIDLSDNEEEIGTHINASDFNSPYFLSLYEAGKVTALGLSANFKSESFAASLAAGLTKAAKNDGPYLVHCVEGKDRTGYVMMLLEALSGASYQEIIDDYMVTYDNYYGINETSDKERYDVIKEKNMDAMIAYVTGMAADTDFSEIDLTPYAYQKLMEMGMAKEDVDLLQSKLTRKN